MRYRPNAGNRWYPLDAGNLLTMWNKGEPLKKICDSLGRSERGILCKLKSTNEIPSDLGHLGASDGELDFITKHNYHIANNSSSASLKEVRELCTGEKLSKKMDSYFKRHLESVIVPSEGNPPENWEQRMEYMGSFSPRESDTISVGVDWGKVEEYEKITVAQSKIMCNNIDSNNRGDNDMSSYNLGSSNTRRVVTVNLWDDDEGLPVELALVAQYTNVVTEDDDQTTIQQVIMDEAVATAIGEHNVGRAATVDEAILKQTGNEVQLRPIKLKDLRWEVRQA